jgi:DNA primase
MHFLAVYIPEEKINDIQNSSDIVDIISEVVVLKKSGKNFLGLCPFHSEKTPSSIALDVMQEEMFSAFL